MVSEILTAIKPNVATATLPTKAGYRPPHKHALEGQIRTRRDVTSQS